MKDCAFIEKLIYPYLDGELDVGQNLEVEAHLLVCQRCCDLLHEEKRFISLIKNGSLRQEGPPALKAKIERRLLRKKEPFLHLFSNHPFKMAFAASLALIVLLLWTGTPLGPGRKATPPFIRASVENHLRIMDGDLPLEIENHDPRAVEAWFKKRIDFMPELPNLKEEAIVLLGGRLSMFDGKRMALISYQVEKSPVTLFIIRGDPAADVVSGDFAYLKGRRFNFSHQHGLNTIAWSDDGNNFALTSGLATRDIMSCKVCHGEGSGLSDLESLLGI